MRHAALAMAMIVLASLWCDRPLDAAEPATIEVVTDPGSGRPRFEPEILFIEPGGSVLFKSAGSAHGSRSIPGMLPDAAEPWWGQIGSDLVVTFTAPGVYGHKCAANYRLGLVGLIVVGDDRPDNLADARSVPHPPAAAAAFDKLFQQLDERYREKYAKGSSGP